MCALPLTASSPNKPLPPPSLLWVGVCVPVIMLRPDSTAVIGAIDCGDLIYWSVPSLKCGVWDAGLIGGSYEQSCASQGMRGDKECMKGNYTYLNHTLVPAPPCCSPCAQLSAHVCLCTHVCLPALLCETLQACVCVCVGVRMQWGLWGSTVTRQNRVDL